MTISDNGNRNQYTAIDGQTTFPYTYKIFADNPDAPDLSNDLNVYLTPSGEIPSPADNLLTIITDYTLTGVGNDSGGNVILNLPASNGDIITIERDVDITRTTDYGLNPEFTGESFDRSFEKSRAIEQQVRGLIENRGLSYPVTSLVSSDSDPNPIRDQSIPLLEANQIWKMNADRTSIVAADTEEPISCSSLRAELADQQVGSDGARLVGYNSDINGATTVRDELDYLDPPIPDNTFHIKNITDDTKEVRFDLSQLDTNRKIIGSIPIVDFIAGYPPYYFKGFKNELDYTFSPLVKLKINTGCARKGFSKYIFVLLSSIIKNISLSWEEGDDKGGLASVLSFLPDTWYHVFVIIRDNGFIDAGFDIDINAINLMSDASALGYTSFLRVGSVLSNNVSEITNFFQHENLFLYSVPMLDVNAINPGTAALIQTLSVPPNIQTEAFICCDFYDGVAGRVAYITNPSTEDLIPSRTGAYTIICGSTNEDQVQTRILTNKNSQIRFRLNSSGTGTTLTISTLGWYDSFNK